MPLPIGSFFAGMFARVVGGLGSGLHGMLAGALGRGAMQGGVRGAASRIGLAGMVSASGKALPAPAIGALGRDFGLLLKETTLLPRNIRDWSSALVESKRDIARFSGSMSAAYMSLDAQKYRLNIGMAAAIGDETKKLIDNLKRLNVELVGWERMWEELKTKVQGKVVGGAADAMEWINQKLRAWGGPLVFMSGWGTKRAANQPVMGDDLPWNKVILDAAEGKFFERREPPQRPME